MLLKPAANFASPAAARDAAEQLVLAAGIEPDAIAGLPVFKSMLLLYVTGRWRADQFYAKCSQLLEWHPEIAVNQGPPREYGH